MNFQCILHGLLNKSLNVFDFIYYRADYLLAFCGSDSNKRRNLYFPHTLPVLPITAFVC